MKKTLLIFLIFISCSKSFEEEYEINDNKLTLSYKIDHTFEIHKLTILTLNSNNFPLEYIIAETIKCEPNNRPSKFRIDKTIPKEKYIERQEAWDIQKEISERYGNVFSDDKMTSEDRYAYNKAERIRKIIFREYFPFIPQNEIHFTKKNENYWWRFKKQKNDLPLLPIKFEEEIWYKISFSNQSCYIDDFYFKFNKNRDVITRTKQGNCGAAW
jgi:hypothetical protein